VSRIPREARDGLMRARLDILSEKHPGVTWVPLERDSKEAMTAGGSIQAAELVVAEVDDVAEAA
jgi:hypothetical protein